MNRATYYSPLVLGALLVLALNEPVRAQFAAWLPWQQWSIVAGAALAFAVQCQVLMIGAQGAFAQVLPVPGGKSMRGGAAALAGWMLVGWFAFSNVTVVLAFGGMTAAAYVVGAIALGVLGVALVTYIWGLPAAIADFGDERRI